MDGVGPPLVSGVSVSGKRVIVRCDLEGDADSPRFMAAAAIVEYLKSNQAAEIKVVGHEGAEWMVQRLGVEVDWDLRRDPREKENDSGFAKELAEGFDVYVNEAFATSHREHASVVALPRLMKRQGKIACVGQRFEREMEMLGEVSSKSNSKRKILVIGGIKVEDKERYAQELTGKFDEILKGGLLPGVKLREDGLDLSDEVIERYKKVIAEAGVIVAAGVMGKYEDPGAEKGTREILNAIVAGGAYKVAGGGDLEAAINKYNLTERFDWISVGGGAMFEYLARGALVGLRAVTNK